MQWDALLTQILNKLPGQLEEEMKVNDKTGTQTVHVL